MVLDNPEEDLIIINDSLNEEEMIALLAEKVQAYLDVDINLLMSYLYRLDVLEYKIKAALSNHQGEAGNVILARLIWERQKERLKTKKAYKSNEIIDEDWQW